MTKTGRKTKRGETKERSNDRSIKTKSGTEIYTNRESGKRDKESERDRE